MPALPLEQLLNQALHLQYAGKLPEARTIFRKVLKKLPAHAETLHFIGINYMQSREPEKGLVSLRRAIAIKPDYVEAHYSLGVALNEVQHFEEAVAALQRVVALNPQLWKAHLQLANTLNVLKCSSEAISYYEQTLALAPNCAEAYAGLGVAHSEAGRVDKAIAAYRQAIKLNPKLTDAHNNLGFAFNLLHRFDEATAAFKQAIALNPAYIDAHVGLARAQAALGGSDSAIVAYKNAWALRQDAQCAYELGELLAELQRFDEAVIWYRHTVKGLPEFIGAWNGLGIALSQLKQFDEAIPVFEQAARLAPENCDALNNLGNALLETKRHDEAIACYKRALAITADFAEAHNGLGNALNETGKADEAIACYRQALAISPDFAEAHNGLGSALVNLDRYEEALACYNQALAIKPDYGRAIYNTAVLFEKQQRFEEALLKYEEALNVDTSVVESAWNLGLLHLLHGRFQVGWLHYEQRWQLKETIALPPTPYPRWLGEEDIFGKSLFIQVEQGHGDAIQMMRYVELLRQRSAECWIQCPESLGKLFGRSFPFAGIITTHAYPEPCDFHVPLMSLPLACRTFAETDIPATVPYLQADAERIAYWKKELASWSIATVGLVWRGNPTHDNDHNRSTTLATYLPLIADHPEIRFVTLQKDLTDEERSLLEGLANVRMLDAELTDFDESAAVMRNLDLMISIDSAPAHLAGALAVPTWILLPFNGEWRWLMNRDDTPWYPTARLFRQSTRGDWNGVIGRIHTELEKLGE